MILFEGKADGPKKQEDLYRGAVLSKEQLLYTKASDGHFMSEAGNNLWMNLQTPPEDADPLLAAQLGGRTLADKIRNDEARARFQELSNKLQTIASWELDEDARREAITSAEANNIYYEMYCIARAHGITNDELLR